MRQTERRPRGPSVMLTARFDCRPALLLAFVLAALMAESADAQFAPMVRRSSGYGEPTYPTNAKLSALLTRYDAAVADGDVDTALESAELILASPVDGYPSTEPAASTTGPVSIKTLLRERLTNATEAVSRADASRTRVAAAAMLRRIQQGDASHHDLRIAIATDWRSESIQQAAEIVVRRLLDGGQLDAARVWLNRMPADALAALRREVAALAERPRPVTAMPSLVPEFAWVRTRDATVWTGSDYVPWTVDGTNGDILLTPIDAAERLTMLAPVDGRTQWLGGPPQASTANESAEELLLDVAEPPRAIVAGNVTLTLVSGVVPAGAPYGRHLDAYETETGRLLWSRLPLDWPSLPTDADFVGVPVADIAGGEGAVLVRSGRQLDLVRFDLRTGDPQAPQPVLHVVPREAEEHLAFAGGLYYVRAGTMLTVFDPVERRLLWRTEWRAPYRPSAAFYDSSGTPEDRTWNRPYLGIGSRAIVAASPARTLSVFDRDNGRMLWTRSQSDLIAIDGQDGERIFAVAEDHAVALSLDRGAELWRYAVPDDRISGGGLIAGDTWVLPLAGGDLVFLDLSTGEARARTSSGLASPGSLTRIGDEVYASSASQMARFVSTAELDERLARDLESEDRGVRSRAGTLRAVRSLQQGDAETAVAELRDGAARGDEAATRLLAQTILSQLPQRWDAYADVIQTVQPRLLGEQLRRAWHLELAAGYGEAGDTPEQFRNELAVVALPPSPTMQPVDNDRDIRVDQLLRRTLLTRWQRADQTERPKLEQIVREAEHDAAADGRLDELRRWPDPLLSDAVRADVRFGSDLSLASQIENALRFPDDAPQPLRRAAEPTATAAWLQNPRIEVREATLAPTAMQAEIPTSLALGPPRIWTDLRNGVSLCRRGDGVAVSALMRSPPSRSWTGSPLTITRRGRRTLMTYQTGFRIVEQRRDSTTRTDQSIPNGWETIYEDGVGDGINAGQRRFGRSFACSLLSDGPFVFVRDNQLVAVDLNDSEARYLWVNRRYESVDTIAADRDFVTVKNGPHAYVLDARTGEQQARRTIPGLIFQPTISPIRRSPRWTGSAAVDHRLLLRDRDMIRLWDPATGLTNWTHNVGPAAAIIRPALGTLLIVHPEGRVEALDAATGRVQSMFRTRAIPLLNRQQVVAEAWRTTIGGGAWIVAAGAANSQQLLTQLPVQLTLTRLDDDRDRSWTKTLPSSRWIPVQPSGWPIVAAIRVTQDRTEPNRVRETSQLDLIDVTDGSILASEANLSRALSLRWNVPREGEVLLHLERNTVRLLNR